MRMRKISEKVPNLEDLVQKLLLVQGAGAYHLSAPLHCNTAKLPLTLVSGSSFLLGQFTAPQAPAARAASHGGRLRGHVDGRKRARAQYPPGSDSAPDSLQNRILTVFTPSFRCKHFIRHQIRHTLQQCRTFFWKRNFFQMRSLFNGSKPFPAACSLVFANPRPAFFIKCLHRCDISFFHCRQLHTAVFRKFRFSAATASGYQYDHRVIPSISFLSIYSLYKLNL